MKVNLFLTGKNTFLPDSHKNNFMATIFGGRFKKSFFCLNNERVDHRASVEKRSDTQYSLVWWKYLDYLDKYQKTGYFLPVDNTKMFCK